MIDTISGIEVRTMPHHSGYLVGYANSKTLYVSPEFYALLVRVDNSLMQELVEGLVVKKIPDLPPRRCY